jgi:hypothetical protein
MNDFMAKKKIETKILQTKQWKFVKMVNIVLVAEVLFL